MELPLREHAREEGAYLSATPVGVGQHDGAVGTNATDERLLFLIIEHREAVGGQHGGGNEAENRGFIVSALHDDGEGNLHFFTHFLYLSQRALMGHSSQRGDLAVQYSLPKSTIR